MLTTEYVDLNKLRLTISIVNRYQQNLCLLASGHYDQMISTFVALCIVM